MKMIPGRWQVRHSKKPTVLSDSFGVVWIDETSG